MSQPRDWTPAAIRALRRGLGEPVTTFGRRFGRSGRTVEDWEQDGRSQPDVFVQRAMTRVARALLRRRLPAPTREPTN